MTRVIRNSVGLYFKQNGTWTEHFLEAQQFADTVSVLSAKRQNKLQAVNLVLVVREQPYALYNLKIGAL